VLPPHVWPAHETRRGRDRLRPLKYRTVDLSRYARQTILPSIGEAGQRRLLASRVLVVGCGATGTVIANHLARAGVGTLTVADRDFVELNNLQRQLLFDEEDVREGLPKAAAAERRLRAVNSEIEVRGIVADVHAGNVEELVRDAGLVMDGTDNFETRYVLNDACVKLGKPWIYTGAVAAYGMTMRIEPGRTPCLRCVFPEPPPAGSGATCDTAGVLGPAVSVVASLAASEAVKFLVGAEEALAEGLLQTDVWDLTFRQLRLARKADCPCCALREFPFLQVAAASHAATLCGRNAVQIAPTRPGRLDLAALAERLRGVGEVSVNRFLLKLRLQPPAGEYLLTVFPDARAIIQGTTDEAVARSLYSRYVGM
jgi:molybdopterin-synthase adenylyltransferase